MRTLIALFVTALATASAPQTSTPAAGGASRLSGRVFGGSTNQPLYRATVQLQLSAVNVQTSRWTSTDAQGRWSFANVAPGTYTVTASRAGFVNAQYGQRTAHGKSSPVVVGDNTVLDGLDITLMRGGVIVGRITNDLGDPASGALVTAERVRFVDGTPQLFTAFAEQSSFLTGFRTDDRGDYRIYGLPPGTYYVSAATSQGQIGRTDDREVFARTYAPGTALVAGARPIVLGTGEEARADFSLVRTSLVAVAGKVTIPSGSPAFGNASLVFVAAGHGIQASTGLGARIDLGAFTIPAVPPGNYYLHVSASSSTEPTALAVVPLAVSDTGIRDLFIHATYPGSASGILRAEAAASSASLNGLLVAAQPLDRAAASTTGARAPTAVGPGGTFRLFGLVGRHLIRLPGAPSASGWYLKSVTVAGADVTDTGFAFEAGQDVTLDVVVTQRMASISGSVVDGTGTFENDCTVIVFAADETKWTPQSRFIVSVNPRADGRFSIAGLPAGNYIVVAVPPIADGDETNPDQLRSWRAVGQPVTLTDGHAATVAVRLR